MIYIRTDLNLQIATGHLMRCLSIADALTQFGESVTFILADEEGSALIKERGYQSIVLNTKWDEKEAELPKLLQIIQKLKISKLLIDSYQVTWDYLNEISRHTKTIYIDDLHQFEYPVNVIVCYANYWKKFYHNELDSSVQILGGTRYVPLRAVFWNCKGKEISRYIKRILLLSGGTDPYDFLGSLLNVLDISKLEQVDVICGRYSENYNLLSEKYKDNKKVVIHQAVSDIENYMQETDLAVSAGGTTLYELCACGTPVISYSFADNQLDNVKQFEQDNLIDYAGDLRFDDVVANVNKFLERYQNDAELRKQRSIAMQKLVDGKGTMRLAKALCGF